MSTTLRPSRRSTTRRGCRRRRRPGAMLPFAAPAFVVGIAAVVVAVVALGDVGDPSAVRWVATVVAAVLGRRAVC